jgi:hypothetical protein
MLQQVLGVIADTRTTGVSVVPSNAISTVHLPEMRAH